MTSKFYLYEIDKFQIYIDIENSVILDEEFLDEVPGELIAEYIEIDAKWKEIQKKLRAIKGDK